MTTPTALPGARVMVTGARGRIGGAVCAHLSGLGADVVGLDRPEIDTQDAPAVARAMAGIDAVVHLAAIPSPELAPWPEVFATNVTSTFNVLWAAAEHGVQRAVIASSINASGILFNSRELLPAYFPFDEQIPTDIEDPYSLSKSVDEQTAHMAWRKWGIDVAAIRFPFTAEWNDIVAHSERLVERPEDGVAEGWTYLDVRDAARAVELGLTRPISGVQAIFVSADETAVPYPTEDLLQALAADVPRLRAFVGREVPADLTRAHSVLAFRAEHVLELEHRVFATP